MQVAGQQHGRLAASVRYGAPWRSYKFEVLEETDVTLCRCKRTQDPPFCDCQHESVV